MMSGESESEKSQYWNRVLTVDMSDIVFLHCHQSGKGSHIKVCVIVGKLKNDLSPMFMVGMFAVRDKTNPHGEKKTIKFSIRRL